MTIKRSTGFVDKLNGVQSNIFTNGDFSSATTGWTAAASTLSSTAGGQVGNCLTIANSGAASGSAYQDITTVVGRLYKLYVYFQKGSGVSGGFAVGTTAAPTSLYNSGALTDATWALYTIPFIATATTTRVTLRNDSTTTAQTALFDTLVCEEIFDGVREIMRNCKCYIFTGAQAADADTAAISGNRLATVTLNETATGLTFTTSANGVVSKPGADVWKGNIDTSGTATWFRFCEDGDDPYSASSTRARFDGTIGASGTDMIVGNAALTAGLKFEITAFNYTAPKA